MEGLRRVKDRDGVPLSVQVDRALQAWLKKQGVPVTRASKASRRDPKTAAHVGGGREGRRVCPCEHARSNDRESTDRTSRLCCGSRLERRRVRGPRRQRCKGSPACARPARRRCAAPSGASGRVLASRSSRAEPSAPGDAARRLAFARDRVRHARRGDRHQHARRRLVAGVLGSIAEFERRASKSAFELALRVCAHKAGAWAGNPAVSRTSGSRLSRISPPGRPPSASASLIRWSPAGAL